MTKETIRTLDSRASPEVIQMQIEGVIVTGIINYRHAADISVSITSPYQNLTTGCHIPYFGRPFYNYKTGYGIERTKDLLTGLYKQGQHIEANYFEIFAAYQRLQQNIQVIKNQPAYIQCSQQKKALKSKLKSGELNNKEYQKRLSPLKKAKQALDFEIFELESDFLSRHDLKIGRIKEFDGIFHGEGIQA